MTKKDEILPGMIVEFFQDQQVYCAVVIGTKNQRLLVLSETNRELNISKSRILDVLGPMLDIKKDREEIISKLKSIGMSRDELAKSIHIDELWSLLEEENRGFTIEELAEFIFTEPNLEQTAALQRMLIEDRLLFQYKGGIFYPRSKENVEQRKIQLEREAQRKHELEVGVQWLKNIMSGDIEEYENNTVILSIIEKVRDFAIKSTESSHYAFIKELFKEAGLNLDPQVAFKILVQSEVWKEDENILIYQFDIPRDFNHLVIEYTESFDKNSHKDKLDSKREDFTEEWTITIDGSGTLDIDDALSFKELPDGTYRVGVHITDVSSYIQPNDPLDQAARDRMTTVYLPDEKIPMLPQTFSEDICSLIEGEKRRAMSFIFHVDHQGNILSEKIIPSFIRVDRRMTYEEANDLLNEVPALRILHMLSQCLQEKRKECGALIIHVPEVQAVVNTNGKIQIKRYNQDEPAQTLISEWMIAANTGAARFFQEHDIPAIYRCQSKPKHEEIPNVSEHYLFYMLQQRRIIARAEISPDPGKHCGLGVECYVSITSPIRRYVDLILQRQLRSFFLFSEPYYDRENLDKIITDINATIPKVSYLARKWNKYWILKYLKQENITEVEVLVLDQNDRFIHVVIPDYMLEVSIQKKGSESVGIGQVVMAKIEHVNPRTDTIKLRLFDN